MDPLNDPPIDLLSPSINTSNGAPADRQDGSRMSSMKIRVALIGGFVAVFLAIASAQPAQRFDLLIRNGRVMDGTGNPWFPADIGVLNGRIAAIGKLGDAQATRVIDAAGKYVVPG